MPPADLTESSSVNESTSLSSTPSKEPRPERTKTMLEKGKVSIRSFLFKVLKGYGA